MNITEYGISFNADTYFVDLQFKMYKGNFYFSHGLCQLG